MNSATDLREVFLASNGRLARTPFWVAAAVVLIPGLLYTAVDSSTLHWATGWVVYPALIYCGVCVLSKRLHDRGRSGWFSAAIIPALIGVFSWPFNFFDFVWCLILVWAVVELFVLEGEQGANRFGLNPQAG